MLNTLTNNAVAVGKWLAVGLLARPSINGFADTWMLHTATWTLQYEWIFYLALPILAIFAAPRFALLPAVGILIFVWLRPGYAIILNFLAVGMAAHIYTNNYLKKLAVTDLAAIISILFAS